MLDSIKRNNCMLIFFVKHKPKTKDWKYSDLLLVKFDAEKAYKQKIRETGDLVFESKQEMLNYLQRLLKKASHKCYEL